jgi:hypothetical protein
LGVITHHHQALIPFSVREAAEALHIGKNAGPAGEAVPYDSRTNQTVLSNERNSMREDRTRLQALLSALDGSMRGLRRDDCGDYFIVGKKGHVYSDGAGYLLYSAAGSVRRWGFVKKRLAFCHVAQDGDGEGALHLDRLPTTAEAAAIRQNLGIRKRKQVSADTLAGLRDRFSTAEIRPIAAKDASDGDGSYLPLAA